MKLAITKTMLKELRKAAPSYCVDNIYISELTPEEFAYSVSNDLYVLDQCFDYETGLCKVFRIVYKDEFYAMDKFVTVKNLSEYAHAANMDYEKFLKEFENAVMI